MKFHATSVILIVLLIFFLFHSVITNNDALPKKRVASMLVKFRQHKHELDEVRHKMSVLERKKQTEVSQQSKKKKIDKRKKAKQARKLVEKNLSKRPLKIDKTKILMTNGSLMKVESTAECSPWSILQYF